MRFFNSVLRKRIENKRYKNLKEKISKETSITYEVVGYFEGLGIDAKIKPDSFVTSYYANRYGESVKVG